MTPPPGAVAIARATAADVAALFDLRRRVAVALTLRHGPGHWSSTGTAEGIARTVARAHVLVARAGAVLVGTLALQTRKPWAIDVRYFTPVAAPLYLVDMRVDPDRQGEGIGRALIDAAGRAAVAWPAGALRLDAYDAPAGAGSFYRKCGFEERGRAVYRDVPLVYFERVISPPAR